MRIHFLLFLLFGLSGLTDIIGQIDPPQLQCVRSDTLFWELPQNTCGSFNSYEVFASTAIGGPYSLIGTVSTQSQNFYYHNTVGNTTWYYYLLSDFDCPGEVPIPSDTLDNKAPLISPIQQVTVTSNGVEIDWQASASAETIGYIIYKNTILGTVPIDTVYGQVNYLDLTAISDVQSETYYILALDACGNTSLYGDYHKSIFLSSNIDSCSQSLALDWNLYENWMGGIGHQEVWAGIDGNPPVFVDSLGPLTTSYRYENIDDETTYCLYIKAFENGSNFSSNSNILCITTDIIQPVRNFWIKNISVNADNSVDINWRWNTDAEINQYRIFSSDSNTGNFEEILNEPIAPPLFSNPSYDHLESGADLASVQYYLETLDDCDTLAQSNKGRTIFLTGIDQTGFNEITWTAFDIGGATLIGYDVYRVTDGGESLIGTVEPSQLNFTDQVNSGDEFSTQLCYVIKANALMTFPDGSTSLIKSSSNRYCVEQEATIFVPNALAPAGRNYEFKPVIQFANLAVYQMVIFDRWGKLMFETSDINQGWNGKKNGKFVMPGSYVYVIELTQPSGRTIKEKGVVVVVY